MRWISSAAVALLAAAPFATCGGSMAVAAASVAQEKAAILALRAEDNQALLDRDLDTIMKIVADDYVGVAGDGEIDRSKAENRKAWMEELAKPGYGGYVRTATDVQIGENHGVLRGAENGRWEGLVHKPAGDARPFGRYFIHWSKATGEWRMVSEIYVTLGCGGAGC